ncbi:MAG: N-acetyltransferase [bacterium]|jgi:GNAT superfamily N-acetyltransferase|nr:N-acetyltransferase [candidate division KSB1 bacterium]MDH7560355.1 N-acetyltransferase [bacterium]
MSATASLVVRPVRTRRDLNRFVKLPWQIYRGNPSWVPPLIADVKKMLDREKNPFFQHSQAEYYLAERDGQTVGRIAAIVNDNHNQFHHEKTGFFGFFECVNDQQVADALFGAAASWLRGKGMEVMRGPMNPSSNDTIGLLLDAYDLPPVIMMTYNPPYYVDLVNRYGMTKAMDVYAYWMDASQPLPEKLITVTEKVQKKEGLTFRSIDMKDFWAEVDRIHQIYNKAWSYNWGFVPMTTEEFHHLAKDLKTVVDPDLAFIAEMHGQPVGFCLTLPDFNQALHKINGRLFPFGLFKLLYYAKKIDRARVITMGVIREYQKRGIDGLFYLETYRRAVAKGYKGGEFSWVLENNVMMRRTAEMMGGRIYKTYRIYDYKL